MKPKLLCILHRSPPSHGAAKVGDFIAVSKQLNEHFDCRFITIKSSDTIADIGRLSFRKIYLVFELYFRVFWALLSFRPDNIYFTASVKSIAFYRDFLISSLWKFYCLFKKINIYYHYHTKGVNAFVKGSCLKLKLTRIFLKEVNLILLSPLLEADFKRVKTYREVFFLPNGVENKISSGTFDGLIGKKYNILNQVEVLYLSNMIKSKGYFEVLKLATKVKNQNIHFHFAGGWENNDDRDEFLKFVIDENLSKKVTFHGFVNGAEKDSLFKNAHIFIFPTRYPKEAFPLSILEALSYGIPVLASDEASIPSIINKQCGTTLADMSLLEAEFNNVQQNLLNTKTSKYCRKRYLDNFSLEQFEINLVKVFKSS